MEIGVFLPNPMATMYTNINYSRYFIFGFGARNKMIDPFVILAMPFNFILSSSHMYYIL